MKRVHSPATTRSEGRRLGDRFRERLRISSWCLTSTDSATTERAPPGPASRATVASRCKSRTARSRTPTSYQDRDTGEECSRILEFAMHRCPTPRRSSRSRALGPEVIEQLHRQVVEVAKRAGVTHGRRFRIDTTVVETNVHYPTDST